MSEKLFELSVGNLVADKKELYTIEKDTTVKDVLALLQQKNILSVPVYDKKTKQFLGVINMWELMLFVAFPPKWETSEEYKGSFSNLDKEAADLIGLSDEGKTLWLFEPQQGVKDLLEAFSKGVHRVLVAQKDDKTNERVYRLLSQSDVVRHIHKNKSDYNEKGIFEKTVEELNLVGGASKIQSVKESAKAIEGFRVLGQKGLNSACVVDENGGAIGNLSISDLRGMNEKGLADLNLPVLEFLKKRNAPDMKANPEFGCVSSATKLGDIIEKVVKNKIHRVWVVDQEQKPIGIVTLSDIICKFSPYDFKE